MEDVEGGLALHAGLGGETSEVIGRVAGVVPGVLDLDRAILGLEQENGATRPHPSSFTHRLGDDDLSLRADLRRPSPIQRDPITDHVPPPIIPDRHGITVGDQYDLLPSMTCPTTPWRPSP